MEIQNLKTEYECPKFRIWLEGDIVRLLHYSHTNQQDAEQILHKLQVQFLPLVSPQDRCLLLAEMAPSSYVDHAARKVFAAQTKIVGAVAIVLHSKAQEVIGNVFLSFTTPEIPTKLFSSEEPAKKWLLANRDSKPNPTDSQVVKEDSLIKQQEQFQYTFEGNILIITVSGITDIDRAKDHVKRATQLVSSHLGPNKRSREIVDLRNAGFVTLEARKYFSSSIHAYCEASALVVDSKSQRILGNLYLSFANPLLPTSIFNSIESAKSWLLNKNLTGAHQPKQEAPPKQSDQSSVHVNDLSNAMDTLVAFSRREFSRRTVVDDHLNPSIRDLHVAVNALGEELEESLAEVDKVTSHLRQARDAAEAANQAKSLFLANISHELRTPMHAVISFAEIAMEESRAISNEKLTDSMQEILDSSHRLMMFLNDLLDLSRLEANKIVYDFVTADIVSIARTTVAELEILAAPKGITMDIEAAEEKILAYYDASKIRQVFTNLLSNGIKFADPHTTITIQINAIPRAVQVSIRDTGLSIPHDELDAVFDKFVQSSHTRTGAGGTGLGLAICKQIIDDHEGRIWAQSDEHEVVFHFTIPRSPRITPQSSES